MTSLPQFELGPARHRGGLVLYLGQRRRDGMPVVVAAGPGAGNLAGPSFPPVVARGEDWVAFSRPPGYDLAVRLAGGPLPLEETLRLGIAAARLLLALHERQPPVMLVDLGPGAIIQGSGRQFYVDLMAPPLLPESPYLAPELAGDKSQATPAADMYSLGALLYHSLVGYPPGRPPVLIPREPSIPPLLNALLARCLSLDPDHRPRAADLVQDLRSLLYAQAAAGEEAGVATEGEPAGPPAPPAQLSLRHRGGRAAPRQVQPRPSRLRSNQSRPAQPLSAQPRPVGAPPAWAWLAVIIAGALTGVGAADFLASRPLQGSAVPAAPGAAGGTTVPAAQMSPALHPSPASGSQQPAPVAAAPQPGQSQGASPPGSVTPAGAGPETARTPAGSQAPPAPQETATTPAASPAPATLVPGTATGSASPAAQADLPLTEQPPPGQVPPEQPPPGQVPPRQVPPGQVGAPAAPAEASESDPTGTEAALGAAPTGETDQPENPTGSASDQPQAGGEAPAHPTGDAPVAPRGTPARMVVNGFALGETIVFWSGNRVYLSAAEFQRLFGITVQDEGNQVMLVAGNQTTKAESFQRADAGGLWIQVDSESLNLAGYTYLGAVESGGLTHVYLRPLAP